MSEEVKGAEREVSIKITDLHKSYGKKEVLKGLDLEVYPGHDVSTTLEREKCYNPYMKGI